MNSTYVFICGLHRSGTSILNRMLQSHAEITGFSGTGASEDEGQHLQTVLPHDGDFGGPGTFCFHPSARLTDRDLPRYAARLPLIRRSWVRHWDADRPVRVEKSPPNLIRARFLQAGFPGARFIFIVRHPIVVSMATRKWSDAPIERLVNHWLAGHRLMLEDLPHLAHWHVVRYEDLAFAPEAELSAIWRFIGLDEAAAADALFRDLNGPYLAGFERSGGLEEAQLDADATSIMRRFAYTLHAPFAREPGVWHFEPQS